MDVTLNGPDEGCLTILQFFECDNDRGHMYIDIMQD